MAPRKSAEPTTTETEKNRTQQLLASELVERIRKLHGANILMPAADYGRTEVARIPTGIFSLDYALGGGFPVGMVTTVYGHKSSAKSSTLMRAIGSAQKMCANCWTMLKDGICRCGDYREPVCAYIDVEGTYDKKWAEVLGIDNERMLLSVPEYAEQSLDIGEALLRSKEIDILVLDSLAFLVPMKEIEESTEKDLMGLQPRLIGKGIRKFVAALNSVGNETSRRPTVFFTNQIRNKLGVMYGSPETMPGGLAAGFAAGVEVRFKAGKYEMDDTTGKPRHVDIEFRVEKNKTGSAKMEGSYRLMLMDDETKNKKMGDVYDENLMIALAEKLSVVTGRGNSWNCMGEHFGGRVGIEQRLLTDPEFKAKFWEHLLPLALAVGKS